MCNSGSILTLIVCLMFVISGCERDYQSIKSDVKSSILEHFDAKNSGQLHVGEILAMVPSSIAPPNRSGLDTSGWEYLAISVEVEFHQPTYQILSARHLNRLEGTYSLMVKEVTPAGLAGVLTGKIRIMKGGSEISGFYPSAVISESPVRVGRFLNTLNKRGEHQIEIVDQLMIGDQPGVRPNGARQGRTADKEQNEMAHLKRELAEILGHNGTVTQF